jgi:hypothetical protein
MVLATNPLDEINDFVLAEDAIDSECSRSVTQEEELSSNPFLGGEVTQPDESTSTFTRKGDLFEGANGGNQSS